MKFATLFCLFLFISVQFTCSLTCSADTNETENSTFMDKLISYHSYIDFDCNCSILDKPVPLGESVKIPLTVTYWTDIPKFFVWFPFSRIENYLLFNQLTKPQATINLEVINSPSWADIHISNPTIKTDIPFKTEEYSNISTNLIILTKIDAPAESYTIRINATCSQIGNLQGNSHQESIFFTPAFHPCLEVDGPKNITLSSVESKNVSISVRNCGNKLCRITPFLKEDQQQFSINITPVVRELTVDEEKNFTITINSLQNKNVNSSLLFQFKDEQYPYGSNASYFIGEYTLAVDVISIDNEDDSTSPFTVILILILLTLISIFLYYFKYKK